MVPRFLWGVLAISLVTYSGSAHAAITLPWSTTYNCPEMVQGTAPWNAYPAVLCDGIESYGGWTANGQGEQITSAANNPTGGGGRGQRQWNCDGQNCNSGGTSVTFSSSKTELYIRWYMRYQLGYTWSGGQPGYDKVWYLSTTDGGGSTIPEPAGNNQWNFHADASGGNYLPVGSGWAASQGGSTGDGLFHCYEIHMKMNTSGQNNGVGQYWIDGVSKGILTNINYGGTAWTGTLIGSNQNAPANGGNRAVDFDDIAIRTTGPIGCLSDS